MVSIRKILLYLYAFIVIYLPNFSFISPLLSVASLSIIFLIINIILLNRRLYSSIKVVKIWPIIISYVLMIGYITILNIINSQPIVSNITNDILFIIYILNVLSLLIYLRKLYGDNVEIGDYLIKLGLIQTVIIFLMLFIPQFKELANIMYSQGNEIGESLVALTEYRIYGLGSAFTFTLPLIQGLIAVISLYKYDLTDKVKFLMYSIILIVSSVFNARTPLFIYLFVFMLFTLKWMSKRWSKNRLIAIGMLVFFIPIIMIVIIQVNEAGVTWIVDGIEQVTSFIFENEATGNVAVLTESHWFFPAGITFVFGIGMTVSSTLGQSIVGRNSDIGYVNHMYKGGLVYTLTLYLTHFIYIAQGMTNKFLTVILLIYLLLANYKGEILVNNMIVVIVYLLIFENKINRYFDYSESY